MGAVWPTRPGGSKIRPIESCWNSAPPGLIVSAGESCDGRPPSLRASNSHAFAFVTSASPCSLPSSSTGPLLLSRHLCPDGKKIVQKGSVRVDRKWYNKNGKNGLIFEFR